MTQANGDGLESFEWERHAWTGRVVWCQNGTRGRDVTDQEPEAGHGQSWRARFVRRTSRRVALGFVSHGHP